MWSFFIMLSFIFLYIKVNLKYAPENGLEEEAEWNVWLFIVNLCTYCKMLSVLPFTRTYCKMLSKQNCVLYCFFRNGFTTRSIQGWNNNLISTTFQRCINVETTTLFQPHFNVETTTWLPTVYLKLFIICYIMSVKLVK